MTSILHRYSQLDNQHKTTHYSKHTQQLRSVTNLRSGALIVVLDLGAHPHLADERRMFLAELNEDQLAVLAAQVFGSPHEEHVATT